MYIYLYNIISKTEFYLEMKRINKKQLFKLSIIKGVMEEGKKQHPFHRDIQRYIYLID